MHTLIKSQDTIVPRNRYKVASLLASRNTRASSVSVSATATVSRLKIAVLSIQFQGEGEMAASDDGKFVSRSSFGNGSEAERGGIRESVRLLLPKGTSGTRTNTN